MEEFKKYKFTTLVERIIKNELPAIQYELYRIEGAELIETLFEKRTSVYPTEPAAALRYGFSPAVVEVMKSGTEFITVIVSLFSLYLSLQKTKADKKSELANKLDLEVKIKEELIKQGAPPELIGKIINKYQTDIAKFMED